MFGRFSPGKGHEEFLEAAKIISSQKKNVKFLVVGSESYGEPEYAQSIYKLADSYNLKEKLIFTGFREDVPELMGAIDILAVPSHAEAFGNVAIEGMAAGKPVVAANNYGLLDIVVDQKTGLLFKVKEANDLADKLITLIDDRGQREKLGNAGLQRVKEVFDEKKQIKKLEQRFFDLIEAKKND
ncbi:MAG: glycosyltransferase family 4 protein [Melioribacteraceae bacterium]|nr:glycosyltransferase family 4 protein [Melioribacteraceae bacterium]